MSMLVTVTLNIVYVLTVTAKPLMGKPSLKCPEYGGELTFLGYVSSTLRRLTEFDTSLLVTAQQRVPATSFGVPLSQYLTPTYWLDSAVLESVVRKDAQAPHL